MQYYLTGRDTLRCLGLATVDEPPSKKNMDLTDASRFIQYEVSARTHFCDFFLHNEKLTRSEVTLKSC